MKTRIAWSTPRYELSTVKADLTGQIDCYECGETFLITKGKPYMEKKREPICPKCTNSKIVEIQTYGFFMQFCGEHFIPCPECQDELNEILFGSGSDWNLGSDADIIFCIEWGLDLKDFDVVTIMFNFVKRCSIHNKEWTPCKGCQKELCDKIYNASRLTLVNKDYLPPIELWRKWKIFDNASAELSRKEKEKPMTMKEAEEWLEIK